MNKATPEYEALFQEYLRVCNEALAANRHCFPYDRIIQQIKDRLKHHVVQVGVYEEDDAHPDALFDLAIDDDHLVARTPHKPHAKHPWLVSRHYLEEVTQHADTYITNPAQLNWQWLTTFHVGT